MELSEGGKNRLKRIQELKNCDEQKALEYAISVAWLVTEQRAEKNRIERIPSIEIGFRGPAFDEPI